MFCVHCGVKCPDIAKFCPACGKRIPLTSPDNQPINAESGDTAHQSGTVITGYDHNNRLTDHIAGGKSLVEKMVYCRYCGIPISENAKICGSCNKHQLIAEPTQEKSSPDKRLPEFDPFVCVVSIFSLVIEAVIIFLTFTDIFKINVGRGYYSLGLEVGIFDLFDAGNTLSGIMSSTEDAADGLIGYAILCLICIAVCIIYFFYNLFSYSFDNDRYCLWGRNYSHYSSWPAIIFIGATLLGIFIFASMAGEYGSVAPSPTLIGIYILAGIQLMLNIFYQARC